MHKRDTFSVPCSEMMHQVAEIVLYRSMRSLTLLCAGKVGVDLESTHCGKIGQVAEVHDRCFANSDAVSKQLSKSALFRASPILYSQKGVPRS